MAEQKAFLVPVVVDDTREPEAFVPDAFRAVTAALDKWGAGMGYQISYVYAARNDAANAILWLERAYQAGDQGLLSITGDPMFKTLESNPRFEALLRKMNLPE